MRKPIIPATLTAAALVMLGSTAAYAAGTVVTVNGVSTTASVQVTGANTSDFLLETNYGVAILCDGAAIDGTILRGSAVSTGNTIGTIDSMTLTSCGATNLDFALDISIESHDITVRDATGVNAGDPIPVDIQIEVDAVYSGSPPSLCQFQASGSVQGVLNPGTGSPDGTIELKPGYDLTINTPGNLPTCGGEIWDGDLAQAAGGDFDLTTTGPHAGPINHS